MRRVLWVVLGLVAVGFGVGVWMYGKHTEQRAFFEAAERGDIAGVRAAISGGIDIDYRGLVRVEYDGIPMPSWQTALFGAAEEGRLEVVRVLLGAGADLDILCSEDGTALTVAASRYNRVEVVRALLDAGADPLSAKPRGRTALHWAASAGDYGSYLLLREASYKAGMTRGEELALLPEMRFRSDGWVYPIEHMITMTRPMDEVHRLARDGTAAGLREAIAGGGDPDFADADGWTALHWAAGPEGDLDRVRVLLEAGADPNAATKDGYTPLMGAALNGSDAEILRVLVEAGAVLDAVNSHGDTALFNAAWAAEEKVVRVLIDLGADASIQNNWKQTAEMVAEARRDNIGVDVTGAFGP